MRARREIPFLRSPSFPGVSAATARVSDVAAPCDLKAAEHLLPLIAAQRVGGCFWGERPNVPVGATVERTGGTTIIAGDRLSPECDPWHVLSVAGSLVAEGGDEWRTVAWMLGLPVTDSDGVEVAANSLAAEAAAAVAAARYRDPFANRSCTGAEAVRLLALWRDGFDANQPVVAVTGVRWWKRRALAPFFFDGRGIPPLATPARALALAQRGGGRIVYWPSRVPASFVDEARERKVALAQVEDGFVRSAGLGSNLVPPASVTVDTRGIYYDGTTPSDLEAILEHGDFGAGELERAERLIDTMVAARVGKYGIEPAVETPSRGKGGEFVLVIGQVDDDRSVLLGRGDHVGSNRALLEAVRRARPGARIVYRPHPDVTAGHRRGEVGDALASGLADAVETTRSLFALLAEASETHVLSSLAGFEALLRGARVVAHGRPFYAGWGLTEDRGGSFPRRTRQLTLSMLVAGALLRYPRYQDPLTGLPCPAEVLVTRLADGFVPSATAASTVRRAQGRVRAIFA